MTPEEERRLLEFIDQQQTATTRAAARDAAARPRIGMTESALLGGLDGITLGWGDEAAGLFDENLKRRLRERYELAKEQQGGAFLAGSMGSAFVPGLGLFGAAGRLGRLGAAAATGGKTVTSASRLAQRARAGAGAAVPAGVIYGAGQASPNSAGSAPGDDPTALDRALGAVGGGVASAALGAGFPVVAAALMRVGKVAHMPARAAMQAVTGKPDIARAEAVLFERLKQDFGDDAATAIEAAYFRDKAKGGSKPALIDLKPRIKGADGKTVDVAPENTLRLTEYAAAAPGPGRNLVRAEVARRQDQQMKQVETWIEKKTGGDASFQDTLGALNAAQQEAAGPLYAQLQDVFVPASNRLRELLSRPALRGAIQKAVELGLNKGWNLQRMGMLGDDEMVKLFSRFRGGNAGGTPMGGSMSLAALDLIKQALDDAIMVSRNPVSGFGLNARGALKKTAAEFTEALDDATAYVGAGDIYRRARDAHAGFAALKDAAELGRTVFQPGAHSDWLGDAAALATQSERDAALAGLRDAMLEKAWRAQDGADLYKQLLGNKGARQRIAALFGPIGKNGGFSPAATRFFQQVRKEAERLIAINQVYSRAGSQTAPRQLEASDTDEALGQALVNVLTGDARGAMMIGLGKATKAVFGKSPLTPLEAEHVVRQTTTPLYAAKPRPATSKRPAVEGTPLEIAARMRAWEARQRPPTPYRGLAAQATARGAISLN